jgi:hypothetical protein
MLGYNEIDIISMQYAIGRVAKYVPNNEQDRYILKSLTNIHDLLEGLLVEGHV